MPQYSVAVGKMSKDGSKFQVNLPAIAVGVGTIREVQLIDMAELSELRKLAIEWILVDAQRFEEARVEYMRTRTASAGNGKGEKSKWERLARAWRVWGRVSL